jgi:hypothetical protein
VCVCVCVCECAESPTLNADVKVMRACTALSWQHFTFIYFILPCARNGSAETHPKQHQAALHSTVAY